MKKNMYSVKYTVIDHLKGEVHHAGLFKPVEAGNKRAAAIQARLIVYKILNEQPQNYRVCLMSNGGETISTGQIEASNVLSWYPVYKSELVYTVDNFIITKL